MDAAIACGSPLLPPLLYAADEGLAGREAVDAVLRLVDRRVAVGVGSVTGLRLRERLAVDVCVGRGVTCGAGAAGGGTVTTGRGAGDVGAAVGALTGAGAVTAAAVSLPVAAGMARRPAPATTTMAIPSPTRVGTTSRAGEKRDEDDRADARPVVDERSRKRRAGKTEPSDACEMSCRVRAGWPGRRSRTTARLHPKDATVSRAREWFSRSRPTC